jgi:hypothetical protein
MTPQKFIAKWKKAQLSERSAAQQHFLDLCELLGQPKPAADSILRRCFIATYTRPNSLFD